jgi:hypothetical protein
LLGALCLTPLLLTPARGVTVPYWEIFTSDQTPSGLLTTGTCQMVAETVQDEILAHFTIGPGPGEPTDVLEVNSNGARTLPSGLFSTALDVGAREEIRPPLVCATEHASSRTETPLFDIPYHKVNTLTTRKMHVDVLVSGTGVCVGDVMCRAPAALPASGGFARAAEFMTPGSSTAAWGLLALTTWPR